LERSWEKASGASTKGGRFQGPTKWATKLLITPEAKKQTTQLISTSNLASKIV